MLAGWALSQGAIMITKKQMQNAINGYQKSGLDGQQTLQALAKRKDPIGEAYRGMKQDGLSDDDFANAFGVDMTAKSKPQQQASFSDKLKSMGESALVGAGKAWSGLIQDVALAGDAVNENLINPLFGTNLSTNAYEQYTKSVDDVSRQIDERRKTIRGDGTDWVSGGANLVSSLPKYLLGRGVSGGGKLAARVVEQAVRGAADGATQHASNASERRNNITWGAVGGAGGEMAGAGASHAIKKAYNAIKGNRSATTKTLEELGEKYSVRLSAGDINKHSHILGKLETSTEYVPVAGMGGFREAQQKEAKEAVKKISDKFKDNLNSTDYKALSKLQNMASGGDRNAKRVLAIVNKAQTADEVLQASLEMRAWREKMVAGKMYDAVEREVSKLPAGANVVNPTKTRAIIAEKIDAEKQSLSPDAELVKELTSILSRIDDPDIPKDFGNMRLLRSQLGDLADRYANGASSNKAGSKFLGDVRGAVESDIQDFVASAGNTKIKSLYQRADSYYKDLMSRQNKAYGKAMQSQEPDRIYSQFIKAGHDDGARNFYNALDSKGQSALRYKMVEEALNKASNDNIGDGVFSPAKFAGEFERLAKPYDNVFHGADKKEMDGFIKLMRHVERAGQYAENPPTGNRIANLATGGALVSFDVATLGQTAVMTSIAKSLFTTKAGKRMLLAASELPPNAAALDNILKNAQKMAGATGATVARNDKGEHIPTPETLDSTPADLLTNVSLNAMQPPSSQSPTIANPSGIVDSYTPSALSFEQPTMSLTPTKEIDMAQDMSSQKLHAEHTDVSMPMLGVAVKQSLAQLIPPPSDDNPQKQAIYEATVGRTVGALLDTAPMQAIIAEVDSPNPRLQKLKIMANELEQSDEYQAFLKQLPPSIRQSINGMEILNMITANIPTNSQMLKPEF